MFSLDDLTDELTVPVNNRWRTKTGRVTHILDRQDKYGGFHTHCGRDTRAMRTVLDGAPFCKDCLKGYLNASA